ncbi:MAG TPA: hypothetical protein VNF04_16850 [Stellaceae bacterium]|nr:hypothetical protein [Stellaceae bacterium]
MVSWFASAAKSRCTDYVLKGARLVAELADTIVRRADDRLL